MTQTEEDRRRFIELGVPSDKVTVTGNIKFDQTVPSLEPEYYNLFRCRRDISPPLLLAGSTHPGEESVIADVFIKLRQNFPDIRLIIAPRNVERASEVKEKFISLFTNELPGCSVQFFTYTVKHFSVSNNLNGNFDCSDNSTDFPDVIILERMGVLAPLYDVCDVAFVGGSLLPFGGHNPLEPAIFSKPVIFGHHMTDFVELSEALVAAGAAFKVKDGEELYIVVKRLLEDTDFSENAGKRGRELFGAFGGAVDKIVSEIGHHISRK
ncbi:hypothetical protein MTBBW1_150019 [Desulfamplus magnetovallimortis]|uniref:3-deoxy-D-manno-octulosonic acid transferase n=1 Tax=Desulfamplus magnetovallimortis TaxID=1246637 RepID=A0A1W1H8P9_9BACT|nr:hypothetical protein MTBBW1_150019 [Desulfamplus magnetovallimortis]